jgi:hypothetical protein
MLAAVVKACGFDVKTVTIKEMDELDVRLQCTAHHSYVPILTWRAAIHHMV